MKKRLLITTILLCAFAPFAKSQMPEHLSFRGVPLDGTMSAFIEKMKTAGYTYKGTENRITAFVGDYAGNIGCKIGASTLKEKDVVSELVMFLPNKDTWSALAGNYFQFKKMYTLNHGEAKIMVERFKDGDLDPPVDDLSKMSAVKNGLCKYYSVFSTEMGDIKVSIEQEENTICFVKVLFLDKKNSEIIKSKAIEDL